MKNTNIEAFYEHIKKKLWSKKPFYEVIDGWNPKEFSDFFVECRELLPTSELTSTSIFDFVANSSLSGGRHPCISPECRLSSVDTLARFASLYSDSVLIHDPFATIFPHSQIEDIDIESRVKSELVIAIAKLIQLEPLIQKGIIGFASSEYHFCEECYQTHIKDLEFERNRDNINSVLKQRILREVDFKAVISDGMPVIEVNGPEDIVNHGVSILLLSGNDAFSEFVIKKATRKSSLFSKKELQKYALVETLVDPIMSDLTIQSYYSEVYGTQYVTDNEVDFDILSTLNSSKVNTLSAALAEGFSHSVPYLSDIEISRLLELREKEGESFNVYRDSFSKAIQSVTDPDIDKVRQAFNDIVRPDLNNIELTIKNSRKLLWGSVTKDLVFGAGFITVGLFTGLLPPNIGEIVAAVGGFNYIAGSLDKIIQLGQEPSEIRSNKYYFLWKAKKQR